MKRLVLITALVLSAFLLCACAAGISITYKDALAAVSPPTPSPVSDSSPVNATASENGATTAAAVTPDDNPSPDSTGETPGTGVLQPPLLTEMVQKAGLSFDDIGHSQLILVAAEGAAADIYCYDKSADGLWKLNESTGYIKGHVGKNGVSEGKREGDGCTPAGLFPLGYAFGNSAMPETGMTWRAVTAMSYWVDDPNSAYYNKWVEGTDGADWDSAEKLSEMPKYYAYAVVVEYNTENTAPGKGSAVFLHCKTIPTSGCIAAPQEAILRILKWLSEEENPGILILER